MIKMFGTHKVQSIAKRLFWQLNTKEFIAVVTGVGF